MPQTVPPDRPLTVLGWREWLSLPDLNIGAIRAKIDSGARSSALHVEHLHTFWVDGVEWVEFGVRTGTEENVSLCRAPVLCRRHVTDSGGHTTERVFIRTRLQLGRRRRWIRVNLTNRRNMQFPMLLGRSAMANRFVIDPARSYVFGEPEPHIQTTPPA